MAGLERDDSKRRHSFCQIDIAHWGKGKAGPGAQLQLWLQVSIWDMSQAKAGAQLQVSIWDMGPG